MEKLNIEERDLLIELRTLVQGVIEDIRRLTSGTEARLKALEDGKLDKDEAGKLLVKSDSIHLDFEKRIRFLEDDSKVTKTQIKTWLSIAGGALAFVQIAIQVFFDYIR